MKLFFLAALLLPTASAAQAPPASTAKPAPVVMPNLAPERPQPPVSTMPVLGENPAGCLPIARQVAELNNKRAVPQRLDRQPPAHLFYTVDVHIGPCRQITPVHHVPPSPPTLGSDPR